MSAGDGEAAGDIATSGVGAGVEIVTAAGVGVVVAAGFGDSEHEAAKTPRERMEASLNEFDNFMT
ncbi:MAG TPA: hypothetical protein VGB07_34670 [Blastocatellia bacterium]